MLTNVNGKNTNTKKRLEISKRFLRLRVEDGASPLFNKPILNKPDTSFSSYPFFWYLYR